MRTDPELLAVARGDRPADLVLKDGRIVNVFTRRVEPGSVAIFGSRIAAVGDAIDAKSTIDLDDAFVAPGLIDAHMHVESTMMLPPRFADVAVPRGTTTVILDPHEIANVLGIDGIRFLMDQAAAVPMNAFFAASSCVPCSPLETAGASVSAADLAMLLADERVVALAEMMNYPGVIAGDAGVLEKVRLGLRHCVVDGHCPGLTGRALQAYVAAGIGSDHECTTAAEAEEKLRLGMRILIREGSAARNLEALLPLVDPTNAHRFCFCTDDRHPRDLIEDGHVDHVVRRAVALGLDPMIALAMASLHTAEHYRRDDIGAVSPGRLADLIIFDDLTDIRPHRVFVHGRLVAEDGRIVTPTPMPEAATTRGSVRLPADFDETMLRVPASPDAHGVRVIGVNPHQIVTSSLRMSPRRVDDTWAADPDADVLKMAVIERHRGTGNVGLGFVHGFGFRRGAIASTVAHDSHNLSVVGADDGDMVVAARALADAGGGQCVACDGRVETLLPLPIAGLMSDRTASDLVEMQSALHAAARAIGGVLDDPFMPLSFLSLTVIPELKLSDRGLVDVGTFDFVPLETR